MGALASGTPGREIGGQTEKKRRRRVDRIDGDACLTIGQTRGVWTTGDSSSDGRTATKDLNTTPKNQNARMVECGSMIDESCSYSHRKLLLFAPIAFIRNTEGIWRQL